MIVRPQRRLPCHHASAVLAIAVAGGLLCVASTSRAQSPQTTELPDAPSALLMARADTAPEIAAAPADDDPQVAKGRAQAPAATPPPIPTSLPDCPTGIFSNFTFLSQKDRAICQEQNPLEFIVEPGPVKPLTPTQKAILAGKGVIDPFNLFTIVAFSGISVASNSHCGCTSDTPGLRGWGILIGYSLVEDIQGETTGTFLLPVIFKEDPRYHRLPGHPMGQRIWHALGHTVISQGDDGHIMPNYATLINYPLSDEISNLYVPGVATNGPSTAKRIALGYATDPVGAIVAEFLPDVAKRIHIHILFAQQILNQLATGQTLNP
jgi:hypothetical protein